MLFTVKVYFTRNKSSVRFKIIIGNWEKLVSPNPTLLLVNYSFKKDTDKKLTTISITKFVRNIMIKGKKTITIFIVK